MKFEVEIIIEADSQEDAQRIGDMLQKIASNVKPKTLVKCSNIINGKEAKLIGVLEKFISSPLSNFV